MQDLVYYRETNGKLSPISPRDILEGTWKNEKNIRVSYLVNITPEAEPRELSVTVPETDEYGDPVTIVEICCSDKSTDFEEDDEVLYSQSFFPKEEDDEAPYSQPFFPEEDDEAAYSQSAFPTLRYLYIPASVKRIYFGERAVTTWRYILRANEWVNLLGGCTVEISPDNPCFCVRGNGIYNKDMTELYRIFSPGEAFEVPDGVKRIKSGAGMALSGLKRLTVPESVTKIESEAFRYCRELEYADIHAKIIGESAFADCNALTTVLLTGCEEIGRYAFWYCESLRELALPETLIEIGDEAFLWTGIMRLRLPRSVQRVGRDILLDIRREADISEEPGYLRYSDTNCAVLEFYYKDGSSPFSRFFRPAEEGTLMIARDHETGEQLFEFVIIDSIDNIFTEHGIDFTEYDNKLKHTFGFNHKDFNRYLAFFALRVRLRCQYGLNEEKRRVLEEKLSAQACMFAWTAAVKAKENDEFFKFPYFHLIDVKMMFEMIKVSAAHNRTEVTAFLMKTLLEQNCDEKKLLKMIDMSAAYNMTEVTAFLMQKLHEKKGNDDKDK